MAARESEEACALCARERRLTFHHLIPVTLHKNRWFKRNYDREELHRGIMVCRDCHDAIHRFISHKDLGRHFNSLEKLLEHEDLARFVKWVSRQRGRNRLARPSTR